MKLAIVTGGSRGLGEAIVNQLVNNNFRVYELSRSGKTENNVPCDLSDLNSVNNICSSFFKRFSKERWDEILFINNAGLLTPISKVDNLSTDEIALNISVNQTGPFILISKFIETFRDHSTRKTIVNISSGAAINGYAGWSLYCASKAALEIFIRSITAQEEIEEDPFIAINYNPSVMDTNMQAQIRDADFKHFPEKQKFLDLNSNGLLRPPEKVASHIAELIKQDLVSGNTYSILG